MCCQHLKVCETTTIPEGVLVEISFESGTDVVFVKSVCERKTIKISNYMALQIGKIRTSSIEMQLSCLLCSCDNHAYDMLSTQKGVKL